MTIPLDDIKNLDLKEGDLIKISFKEENNTTHVTLPAYFRKLDIKKGKITYSQKTYYTGGIVQYSKNKDIEISNLESLHKMLMGKEVRKSILNVRN